MNYADLAAEASKILDTRAAVIATAAALLAGLIIVLLRHRKPKETK